MVLFRLKKKNNKQPLINNTSININMYIIISNSLAII